MAEKRHLLSWIYIRDYLLQKRPRRRLWLILTWIYLASMGDTAKTGLILRVSHRPNLGSNMSRQLESGVTADTIKLYEEYIEALF